MITITKLVAKKDMHPNTLLFHILTIIRCNKFLVKHFVIKTSDKKINKNVSIELENDRGTVETSFLFLIPCFYNKMFNNN